MTVREDIEKTLDPENFGLPEVARSILAGRPRVAGETSDLSTSFGIDEVVATLEQFVLAFRLMLLDLADEVECLKHPD